jgi:CubicO group peptidase (beta-lactamase class C family)
MKGRRDGFIKPGKSMFFLSFILIGTIVISFIVSPSAPRKPAVIPQNDYTYTIDYMEYEVAQLMKEHDLPSVVIALIDGEDIICEQAFGLSNLEDRTPATLETVYKIGSISKVFTGIEIMRMYEEGLIDLDSPITEYLPDFSIKNQSSDPITVRSLLAHRSGLPRGDTLLGWYWESRPDVLKAQVDSLSVAYQAYPVWERYKYSNIGYEVLGRIIEVVREVEPPSEEAVSGWPYYMREALLVPLGMDDSNFGSDLLLYGRESANQIAMGYHWEDGKNSPINQFDIIQLASGNMQSTMRDMEKFMKYVMNIEEKDNGILAPKTLRYMYEEQYTQDRDPQTNGLGWFTNKDVLDELLVFHGGTNQGFISLIMMMPERKLGFIVLSNSDAFEDLGIALGVHTLELMLETKYDVVPDTKELAEEVHVDSTVLAKYVGQYVINGDIIEVIQAGDQLKVIYRNQKIKMIPITQTKFRLTSWLTDVENITLEFWVGDSEKEDLMILTMADHFICPRYPEMEEIPDGWNELVGQYEMVPRVPSIYSDEETLGTVEILIDDQVLQMSDRKILMMESESVIRIVGGIYSGETMIWNRENGEISWQHVIYKPVSSPE